MEQTIQINYRRPATSTEATYEFTYNTEQPHNCCGQTWSDLGALAPETLVGFGNQWEPNPWALVSQCGNCGSLQAWKGRCEQATQVFGDARVSEPLS